MRESVTMPQMPRPGSAIKAAMGLVFAVWVLFAIGINFLGLSPQAFYLFAGNTDAILHGQLWRLLTAGLLHAPTGPGAVSNMVWSILGLYFLAPTLERSWGARRTALFLVGAVVLGFSTQTLVELTLPASVMDRLGPQAYWYGAMPAVEAVAVAWALSNRGQTVNLMFILPVGARGLLMFVIGMSVLRVIAADHPSEGVFTPFGGMLAGYLFGGGDPSPGRRLLLRIRYVWLAKRAARYRPTSGARPRLRVIEGEAGKPGGGKRPPSDKRFLN